MKVRVCLIIDHLGTRLIKLSSLPNLVSVTVTLPHLQYHHNVVFHL